MPNEDSTIHLGAKLAELIKPGTVVTLSGDLGAGKTTLTRALLRSMGVLGRIKSPTYTLVEPYVISNLYLYHFDFYRFEDPDEWEASGFRECFHSNSICLIEWPEKAQGSLPPPDLAISLSWEAEGRRCSVRSFSKAGLACLNALETPI